MIIRFPTHTSLTGRSLARLLRGDILSHRSFDKVTSTYCLRDPIYQLRNKYHVPIDDRPLYCKTNDITGRVARYKEYFLHPEIRAAIMQEMGERVALFIEAVKRYETGAAATAQAGDK